MAGSVNKYYNSYMKEFDDEIKKEKQTNASTIEAQKNAYKQNYNFQIDETTRKYDVMQQQNEIQKIVNEREVAENMENLGMTDAGLNRTQLTAVQLSAANNSASIERNKQSVVDGLNLELNSLLSGLDNEKIVNDANIDAAYHDRAMQAAVDTYTAEQEAETERIKSSNEATIKAMEISNKNAETIRQNLITYLGDEKLSSSTKVGLIKQYINTATGYTEAEINMMLEKAGATETNGYKAVTNANGKVSLIDYNTWSLNDWYEYLNSIGHSAGWAEAYKIFKMYYSNIIGPKVDKEIGAGNYKTKYKIKANGKYTDFPVPQDTGANRTDLHFRGFMGWQDQLAAQTVTGLGLRKKVLDIANRYKKE